MKTTRHFGQIFYSIGIMTQLGILIFVLFLCNSCVRADSGERIFYVNSVSGNDSNDGHSPNSAWKSLERASAMNFNPGDKLLLCKGCTFYGKLELKGGGTDNAPVTVSAYELENGETDLPIINAKGYLAAIRIENGGNFGIRNLELTSDAGTPVDSAARTKRYGIFITASKPGEYPNIHLKGLKIHHIFATENAKGDGQNRTSNLGYGIFIGMMDKSAIIRNVSIENCSIEMTGHTGIRIFGYGNNEGSTYLDSVTIANNHLKNIGGPGMVPGRCENVLVRGNTVEYSGSSADPRMHARGSGIWPWTCNNVLIEKNKFMHARGKNDSCGAHIDFNCNDVIVQYNVSVDNAGGFVEILGNDHNCSYRYNISVNDGFREKGVDGAQKDGHILWTSGYVGGGNKRTGPFNSYIYNNTIYVKEDSRSCFDFAPTTDGILIANNIFCILGRTVAIAGNQNASSVKQSPKIPNVLFTNNLYKRNATIPSDLIIQDSHAMVGDPGFSNAGGLNIDDYVPSNASLIKDKGIKITKIPGDSIGLSGGLEMDHDILGNEIDGIPDIGAIQVQ